MQEAESPTTSYCWGVSCRTHFLWALVMQGGPSKLETTGPLLADSNTQSRGTLRPVPFAFCSLTCLPTEQARLIFS